MTTIELSETAETLLKRIVESRFGPGSESSMFLIDSMIEHLIHEEARRLGVTDRSQSEDCSHPQGSVLEDEDLEGERMKVSFIGDSDDIRLVYVNGKELMDISGYLNRSVIKISKGDEGFFVVFHYDGMWSMSIRQFDDWIPIPDWLMSVSVNYDKRWPISATLTIEVPDDVEITEVDE